MKWWKEEVENRESGKSGKYAENKQKKYRSEEEIVAEYCKIVDQK